MAEDYAALERLGIGGIINTFRLGAMPHELAAESLTRFMSEVAPNFRLGPDIAMDAAALRTGRQAIAAAVIGNVLEWYDFSAYAFVATIIAKEFFPAGNDLAALLSTFAAFGIGFLAWPLGGIVIGRMADRRGRKAALVLTILMMGRRHDRDRAHPGHATLGWGGAGAPGAGAAGARVLDRRRVGRVDLVHRRVGARGPAGTVRQFSPGGACPAASCGSGTTALLSTVLSPAMMQDWGWRVPFLLGGPWCRSGFICAASETPVFRQAQAVAPRYRRPAGRARGAGVRVHDAVRRRRPM